MKNSSLFITNSEDSFETKEDFEEKDKMIVMIGRVLRS